MQESINKNETIFIPSEFKEVFLWKNSDEIIFTGRETYGFVIVFSIVLFMIVYYSLTSKYYPLLWFASIPILIIIAFFLSPKETIGFNRNKKEITVSWKGIFSGQKRHSWNELRLERSAPTGRGFGANYVIHNKVTGRDVSILSISQNQRKNGVLMLFLNDFMEGKLIKEHYYIDKNADKPPIEED
jgi:hypothetical protein